MIAPILKGEKVILKPMEPKHAKVISKWYNDPKVAKYQDFNFSSEEGVRKRIIKRRKSDDNLAWTIFTKNNELIGEIKLRDISHKNKNSKIGINIGETNCWNQGYATDTLRTVCKYFFKKLKYNRIELGAFAKNIGAIKCYRKCGFKKEGIKRGSILKNNKFHDSVLMSLIKKDYKN